MIQELDFVTDVYVEAIWGADPLENQGGFRALEYNAKATFRSSLAFNATVSWSNITAKVVSSNSNAAKSELNVRFPEIDWDFLQDVYGWAARQWQGWARGEFYVPGDGIQTLILHVDGAIEFWINDVHYFGADFYGYGRAPPTLRLKPGTHRIDIRIVRDVRALGGMGEPDMDIKLRLERSWRDLRLLYGFDENILISDVIGGDFGPIASPYASVTVRNDAYNDIYVHGLEGMLNLCEVELLANDPIKVVPGQTRQIGFRVGCIPSYNRRIELQLKYRIHGHGERSKTITTWPRVLKKMHATHKMTFLHPSGIVSYAILRPPSPNAICGEGKNLSLPVLIALHGAGTEADSNPMKHAFDPLPNLCAWVLYPSGVTSWSGDDWHIWGLEDIEAAVAAIPKWIQQVDWDGPRVDVNKWLVGGHSNGGQGAWYVLTHRPDKVIAAATLSGYSSIQNYVPYTFWHTSDPGKEAVVQASLLSYRHELLLENSKDIPILQQHGSKDDNVPAYNSRLLNQRIEEAGAESTYFEMPRQPHWWDGVMTTRPLRSFFREQLNTKPKAEIPLNLRDFSIVVANAGDMGPKDGVEVLQLHVPNQLGRLDFTFDPITLGCVLHTSNIFMFRLPFIFDDCSFVVVDGRNIKLSVASFESETLTATEEGWQVSDHAVSTIPPLAMRHGRQLGTIDTILRTRGAFQIVQHSPSARHIALQISRNLCQYFASDTEITSDYEEAVTSTGNIVSVAIGSDLPHGIRQNHPFELKDDQIFIRDGPVYRGYGAVYGFGLAATFLRPLRNERLELVVWAADEESLDFAARLVPLITGSGTPDFVIADKKMLSKGVEGTLALGFFDTSWNVSRNSYFS